MCHDDDFRQVAGRAHAAGSLFCRSEGLAAVRWAVEHLGRVAKRLDREFIVAVERDEADVIRGVVLWRPGRMETIPIATSNVVLRIGDVTLYMPRATAADATRVLADKAVEFFA